MRSRFFVAVFFLLLFLCSCSFNSKNQSNVSVDQDQSNITTIDLDTAQYSDSFVTIEKCRNDYEDTVSYIQNSELKHLKMKDAVFSSFPDFDSVGEFIVRTPDISVDESIEVINNWLTQNGFTID